MFIDGFHIELFIIHGIVGIDIGDIHGDIGDIIDGKLLIQLGKFFEDQSSPPKHDDSLEPGGHIIDGLHQGIIEGMVGIIIDGFIIGGIAELNIGEFIAHSMAVERD
jgi:hypothetical protein